VSEVPTKEPEVTLYDYYMIRFGIKPSDGPAAGFKKISINSPRGKEAKRTIDAAVLMTETMRTQYYDHAVADLVLDYLSDPAYETKGKRK